MCREAKPVRSIVLFEGQVNWIMERGTDEEKLAAWETLAAIAFPEDEHKPYVPPPLPPAGGALSPCDRTRRDVFNLFKDLIESRAVKTNGKLKDIKKVEAGRLGAAVRFGRRSESSAVATDEEETDISSAEVSGPEQETVSQPIVPKDIANDDFSRYEAGGYPIKRVLSREERAAIAAWDKKIPNAEALQAYLKKNYLYQNKKQVVSDEFCAFAYHKLAMVDHWISTRDRRPLRELNTAIHWIHIDYMKKAGEIRRAEQEEQRKDIESEFELTAARQAQQSPTELATLERKRRRAAEKAAMDKIMKGEL